MALSGEIGMNSQNIFADNAARYAELGLVVLPVGKETGKQPLINGWASHKYGVESYQNFIGRFPNANIGIRNDNLTIVDLDDPKRFHNTIERFGDTPIKVHTPSGGFHFWYRSSGEPRKTRLEGEKIDILAGKNGIAVAPPSQKPSGIRYSFMEGSSIHDFGLLPTLKPGSLPNTNPIIGEVGQRNTELFNYCKSVVKDCATKEELIELAFKRNATFPVPLSENEVLKATRKPWEYKCKGTVINPGDNAFIIDIDWLQLSSTPDALALLLILKKNHGGSNKPFAISQPEVRDILGWGDRRRVSAAINVLLEWPFIKRIGKGGPTGRAYQYMWTG